MGENYQKIIGALCARDSKGVGSQYVYEDKLVLSPRRRCIMREIYTEGGFSNYIAGVFGTLRASGGSNGGGSETLIIENENTSAYGVVSKGNGEAWITPESHMSLTTGGGQAGQGFPCVMHDLQTPLILNDQGGSVMHVESGNTAPTLRAESHGHEPIVLNITQDPVCSDEISPCISIGSTHGQAAVGVCTEYIVRRLTPLECERLQGFPDNWTDIGAWEDGKGKTRKESADSARYKAIGNSIALPPWEYVLQRLSLCCGEDATMASLFDGMGGFPLIWEHLNGKGSCLWASEIEEFPIAVTKRRFSEVEDEK